MKDLFGSAVVVSVPAQADYVHVLRSVTAGVAARLDYSYDGIDDLRIAVDEACAQLLAAVPTASDLEVRLTPSEEGLVVVASVPSDGSAWPPPNVEGSLPWQILSALADAATFDSEDGRAILRLLKHLPQVVE